jgi:DNA replication protein DnaC
MLRYSRQKISTAFETQPVDE